MKGFPANFIAEGLD
jgi:isoleucyl-tRNA synthetase